eukprot:12221194-Alexandrium_andersonii.AAC.1
MRKHPPHRTPAVEHRHASEGPSAFLSRRHRRCCGAVAGSGVLEERNPNKQTSSKCRAQAPVQERVALNLLWKKAPTEKASSPESPTARAARRLLRCTARNC